MAPWHRQWFVEVAMPRWMRLVMVAALTLAGCDSGGRTPSSPSPTQTTPPVSSPAPSPGFSPPGSTSLAGQYDLTLTIAPTCGVIPEADRTRQYLADITRIEGGRHLVTLSGARFLSGPICTAASGRFAGIGCHQFFASEDIDEVNAFLDNNNDEAHGGHIVEQLPSGGWWELTGFAGGRLTAPTIETSGKASVWYCPLPLGYPFPCNAFQSCRDTDFRLTFSRR